MGFLAVTALTCIFAVLAAPSIKKAPLFWYGVAIGVDLLYFFGVSCGFPSPRPSGPLRNGSTRPACNGPVHRRYVLRRAARALLGARATDGRSSRARPHRLHSGGCALCELPRIVCGRPIDGFRRSELESKRFLDNRARPARPARRSRGHLGEVRSPSDAAGCLEVRPKELVRFLRADIRARAARFISFSSEGPYRSARFVRCGRGNLLPLLRSTRSYMDESACEGIDGFGLRGCSEFLAPFRGGFSTRRFIFDCKGAERAATGQFGFPIDSLRCTGREMREAACRDANHLEQSVAFRKSGPSGCPPSRAVGGPPQNLRRDGWVAERARRRLGRRLSLLLLFYRVQPLRRPRVPADVPSPVPCARIQRGSFCSTVIAAPACSGACGHRLRRTSSEVEPVPWGILW